jgi:hypothetical protein
VDAVLTIMGALGGLGVSIWLGYLVGKRAQAWPEWRYWAANAVGIVIGVAVSAMGLQVAQTWLWVAGLGVMAGSLTGLKYGLGRSVGVWRLIDRG